jgi:DNA-binding LacI/PurR family transcriptional regulator
MEKATLDTAIATPKRRRNTGGSVTLHKVAELAGVHPMTVSRALQGSEKVALPTRENIQRIARELNYTPNLAARALVMGKTNTIAVLTGSINEHYYANLLHLLEIELAKSDYKLLFLRSRDLNRDLLSVINANAVDGIISVDALPQIRDLIASQDAVLPPRVYAGVGIHHWTAAESADVVEVDLSQGVRDAIQAMLDGGCRRIAYLTPWQLELRFDARARVYGITLNEAGLAPEIINLEIGNATSDHELVRSRLSEYLKAYGCPDGIFCQNDEMAIAAYRALRDLKLRVPEDVQLVGCDGLPYTNYFDPPISTIVQPAEEMCRLAWQFLQRRISDGSIPRQQVTLQAHLAVRASLKIGQG